MKIAHISDTHNDNSFKIPECDLFIHSGDLTNFGTIEEWVEFKNYLKTMSNLNTVNIVLSGNHDKELPESISNVLKIKESVMSCFSGVGITFLIKVKNNKTNIFDYFWSNTSTLYIDTQKYNIIDFSVKLGFYNLCPPVPDYLYTKQKRQLLLEHGFKDGKWANEADEQTRWKRLNSLGYCDILVGHAPPTGLNNGHYDKNGCDVCVRDYILKYQPKYVFCGHVHELNGTYKIGKTNVIVSCNTMRVFEI